MRPHMLFAMNIKKYLTRAEQKDHIDLSRVEHREVIKAILDRDAVVAHEVMREYIANGRDCPSPGFLEPRIA